MEEMLPQMWDHGASQSFLRYLLIQIDRLTDEVRQESLWTMMFADDIVICCESRQQLEENLERWSRGGEGAGV